MKDSKFISVAELAKMLRISRIAVFRKIKNGQIKAVKIGRAFAIDKKDIAEITGKTLNNERKEEIKRAVEMVVKEYGETLRLLGKE